MTLARAKLGGVEFMMRNLAEGFAAGRSGEWRLITSETAPSVGTGLTEVRIPVSGNRFLADIQTVRRVHDDYDGILFPNYFTPPILRRLKAVTVIHDLQFVHYPEYFSRVKREWMALTHRLTLKRADRIVAISEFVRNDVLDVFGAKYAEKVVAVQNPVSWDRFRDPDCSQCPTTPFILTVAAPYPHKNLKTLIAAFESLRGRGLQHDLVLVGQTPPGYERFAKGATIGPEDAKAGVTFTGHISNARLAGLYRCADLFVSPSLFEGCGMPIVEALGLGVPTIAAARSAVPEVSQGLAMLVDEPLDVSAWTEAIERALADLASLKPAVEESERLRRHHDPAHVAERYHQVMISI